MTLQYTNLQTEKKSSVDEKHNYTSIFLKAAELSDDITPDLIKQKKLQWWWNVRTKDSGGLRLTEEGLNFIQVDAKIKTYKIDFPKDFNVTPQVLLWLDNFIESPYYITKKAITVLKERSAFELYLFSGDVKKFGYTKALSKRMNQN